MARRIVLSPLRDTSPLLRDITPIPVAGDAPQPTNDVVSWLREPAGGHGILSPFGTSSLRERLALDALRTHRKTAVSLSVPHTRSATGMSDAHQRSIMEPVVSLGRIRPHSVPRGSVFNFLTTPVDLSALESELDAAQTSAEAAVAQRLKAVQNTRSAIRNAIQMSRPVYRKRSRSHSFVAMTVSRRTSQRSDTDSTEQRATSPSIAEASPTRTLERKRSETSFQIIASRVHSESSQYGKDCPTPRRRIWLRALFRWAIGKVITTNRAAAKQRINIAKRELAHMRRRAHHEAEQRRLGERRRACSAFFLRIHSMMHASAGKLTKPTEADYKELKSMMCAINSRPTVTLAEVAKLMNHEDPHHHARINIDVITAVFRKLDQSRSGTLDADDIVHGIFPAATSRDIRLAKEAAGRSEINPSTIAEADTEKVLSSEARSEIEAWFRHCDRSRRGILSYDDIAAVIKDSELRELLGLDAFFARSGGGGSKYMQLRDFMEFVKHAFPPFCSASNAVGHRQAHSGAIVRRGLPRLVVEAQSIATSSVE